jgi:hypothetical protein
MILTPKNKFILPSRKARTSTDAQQATRLELFARNLETILEIYLLGAILCAFIVLILCSSKLFDFFIRHPRNFRPIISQSFATDII